MCVCVDVLLPVRFYNVKFFLKQSDLDSSLVCFITKRRFNLYVKFCGNESEIKRKKEQNLSSSLC